MLGSEASRATRLSLREFFFVFFFWCFLKSLFSRSLCFFCSRSRYNYHGFENTSAAPAPPVAAKANKRTADTTAETPAPKRSRDDAFLNEQLSTLNNLMNRTLPARPTNIRGNEQAGFMYAR